MKYFILLIFIVLLFGCNKSNTKKVDIPLSKILETELIDLKPYIVLKNRVDTMYEIITDGKIGFTKKGDTLNSYINISDTIHSKLNSVMCCDYEYYFNNDLLTYKKVNTEYTVINNYEYYTNDQFIYQVDKNNLTDTLTFKVLNNKISWKLDLNNSLEDTTFYYYKNGYLINKIEGYKSHLNEGNIKYITEFKRSKKDNSIEKIIYKGINTLQILKIDKIGIPKESIYINYDSLKSDTICKTKFQYSISTK